MQMACRQLPFKPPQGGSAAVLRKEELRKEGPTAVVFFSNQPDVPVDRAAEMLESLP